MRVFGYICAIILTNVVAFLYSGLALTWLWSWFIVPIFSIRDLAIAEAIGVALIFKYLTIEPATFRSEQRDWMTVLGHQIGYAIGRPTMAIAIGWIVSLFL